MSAPIVRRVCSACLLRRQFTFASFTTLGKPATGGGRACGISSFHMKCPVRTAGGLSDQQGRRRLSATSSTNTNGSTSVPSISDTVPTVPESQVDYEILPNDEGVLHKVTEAIRGHDLGRLFAVVQVAGKQFKVTTDDIVVVEGYFPPEIGDRIRLEKVLLAGSKDFTLLGRPILDRESVTVEATVIEKTLSVPKVFFHYLRRKGYRRFKLLQVPQTMIVINTIEVSALADDSH